MENIDKHESCQISAQMSMQTSFAESCLPLTMTFADQNQELIKPHLILKNRKWSFHDKVIVWILKNLHPDVMTFYNSAGPSMENIFLPHQINSIDEAAYKILKEKLRGIKGAQTRSKKIRSELNLDVFLGRIIIPKKKSE